MAELQLDSMITILCNISSMICVQVSELFTAVKEEKQTSTPINLNKNINNVQRSSSLCGRSNTFFSGCFYIYCRFGICSMGCVQPITGLGTLYLRF